MPWYDDYMNYGQNPGIQMGQYGATVNQVLAGLPQATQAPTIPGAAPATGGGGGGQMMQAAGGGGQTYDYYNQHLASLLAQMQGQYMSNDQFYAGLGLQREQMERLAEQWAQEFGWSKEQSIAMMLMQQQQSTGRVQTNPYLTQGGAQMPGWATDIYQRIWAERPDLQQFYDQNWGQGQYDVGQAVQDWMQMTGEESVVGAGRDPMQYAISQGWYDPEMQGQYPAGSWQNTLERDIAEWTRELSQEQMGLQYLGLLGSMRGPRDWLAYARTVQGAGQTNLPAWAEAMMNRTALPSFGQWGAYAPGQQGGHGQGVYGHQGYDATVHGMGQVQPHQIHPQQWANMAPALRDMFMATIEEQGGYAPDFGHFMQQSWPTQGATNPMTYWG